MSEVKISLAYKSTEQCELLGGASCDDDDKDESRQEALETHSLEASPAALGGEAMSEGIDSASHPAGPPAPLLPQLVTMSMLPKSQWQNLIHLDAIKVCADSLWQPHWQVWRSNEEVIMRDFQTRFYLSLTI